MSTSERPDMPPNESPPGVSATEALTGVPLSATQAGLERARLAPVVAAALRAALDRLAADRTPRAPLVVGGDDAVLEVRIDRVDASGLGPAGIVLETVGGNLGPTPERPGSWLLRVPVLLARPTFLMLEQGTLSLAVPWHAVARVRMVPTDTIESMARRQGYALLPPFAEVSHRAKERPVLTIGLGLKRALLVADRLVWRLSAEPMPGVPDPQAMLSQAVRTHEGVVYWVVDPERLLRDLEPPPIPEAREERVVARNVGALGALADSLRRQASKKGETAAAPALAREAGPDVPSPGSVPVSGTPGTRVVAPRLQLIELKPEHVDPIDEEPIPQAAPPEVSVQVPETAPVQEPPAPSSSSAVPRALIGEDSITARIFLERLLAQRGFEVEAVSSAGGLHAAMRRSGWDLVMADIDLPDAPAAEHLRDLARAYPEVALVALVRDVADEREAAAAGVARTLRKPFEAEALDHVLKTLRLAQEPRA